MVKHMDILCAWKRYFLKKDKNQYILKLTKKTEFTREITEGKGWMQDCEKQSWFLHWRKDEKKQNRMYWCGEFFIWVEQPGDAAAE